jgi:hypothetical protein
MPSLLPTLVATPSLKVCFCTSYGMHAVNHFSTGRHRDPITHVLLLLLLLLSSSRSTFATLAANSSSPVALQAAAAAAAGSQGVPACLPPALLQQLFAGLLQLLPDLAAGVLQQLSLQLLLRLAETGAAVCWNSVNTQC